MTFLAFILMSKMQGLGWCVGGGGRPGEDLGGLGVGGSE